LNRGDLSLGHEAVMAWHEAAPARPRYLFKLKLTSNVRRALHALPESACQGPGAAGVWPVAEARVRLPGGVPNAGWSSPASSRAAPRGLSTASSGNR
jgi:hypothetical protein